MKLRLGRIRIPSVAEAALPPLPLGAAASMTRIWLSTREKQPLTEWTKSGAVATGFVPALKA